MARGAVVVVALRRSGPQRAADARRPRDQSASRASPTDRIRQPWRPTPARSSVRAGGIVAALPHADALVSGHSSRPSARSSRRWSSSRRARGGAAGPQPHRARRRVKAAEGLGEHQPQYQAARSRCPAGTGRARGATPPRIGRPIPASDHANVRDVRLPGDSNDPACPPHPQGEAQPSFCRPSRSTTRLTAHKKHQRLASLLKRPQPSERTTSRIQRKKTETVPSSSCFAYHPTSRSCSPSPPTPTRNGPSTLRLVARSSASRPLDVQNVPAAPISTAVGTATTRARASNRAPAAIARATAKYRDEAQLLAASPSRPQKTLRSINGAPVVQAANNQLRQDSQRASPSTRTAPASCRQKSRASSMRRPSTATDRRTGRRAGHPAGRCPACGRTGRSKHAATSASTNAAP